MKKTIILIGLLAFGLGIGLAQYYLPQSSTASLIEAEGYETITVAPQNTGHLGSNKIGPKLEKYLRTVKMKKIQSEDEEAESDEEEAEDEGSE